MSEGIDKKRSFLNVFVAISFKVILLVAAIAERRFLIDFIGNEINGINSLYLSIVNVLSVAELGVGTAIAFSMYKPIVERDTDTVAALYHLFAKLYLIIGGIITIGGLAVMPFLPNLAKGYTVDINLYFTFFLMLLSVVMTYLYSAKTSLINAYKDNYITTTISSSGLLLQYVLQLLALYFTQSYVAYLLCRIIATLVQWIATNRVTRIKYDPIIHTKAALNVEKRTEVVRSIKAMFMHKIGSVLVNSADSLIISAFIGVVILGKYSNYVAIMTSMTGVIVLFFTPLTSIIGHLNAQTNGDELRKYYNFFYTFNYIVGCLFFLGYYAIIDNLVTLCFGEDLLLSKSVIYVITLNYFIQFLRNSTLLFRDATGTFYYDRFKPLAEGLLNIVLSIALVCILSEIAGDELAIVGVILATIITNLLICHIVEPYVLFKHSFKARIRGFYLKSYTCMAAFAIVLWLLDRIMISADNQWVELIANGFIAVGLACLVCVVNVLLDKDFRHYAGRLFGKLIKRFRAKNSRII